MRTTLRTTSAALALIGLLSAGAAQAQEFPSAALATRPSPAVPGSAAPSADVARIAEFPRSALAVAAPSASDRAPVEAYDLIVQFPHSAIPAWGAQTSLGGAGQNR